MNYRIANMITRGIVTAKNAAQRLRTLQVELFGGETRAQVEDFEPYGFTAEPHDGAEVLVVSLGGDREHSIAVCHPDRRHRPTGLKSGEVVIYDDLGRKVFLSRDGIRIEGASSPVTVATSGTVTIDAPLVKVTGNLEVEGTVSDLKGNGGSSMDAMRSVYNSHTHNHGPEPDQRM